MFHGMVMISTRVCCYDTRVKWNCMLHWHCTAYNIQHTHSLLALNPPTVQWTSSASVNLHQRVNPSVPWFDKSILLGNPGLCWISHGAGAEQPGARPRPVPPQRPLLVTWRTPELDMFGYSSVLDMLRYSPELYMSGFGYPERLELQDIIYVWISP